MIYPTLQLPRKPIILSAILVLITLGTDAQNDEEPVFELSPFEVAVEQTRGYLATNSLTATGFNAENYKIPLSISVATEDFIKDIAATDLVETTYYLSGITTGTGDPGGRQGANYIIRGFESAWQNRNGVRVYNISGTDNVARFEVIKGPNSVFYGEVAPGGIVNYVTKRASFTPEHSVTLETNTNGRLKGKLESQGPIKALGSDKWLAYRFMASYEDDKGWRDFEYRDRRFYFGGIKLRPLTGLDIYLEYEKTREDYNFGNIIPMGNRQYLADFENPPDEAIDLYQNKFPGSSEDRVKELLEFFWMDVGQWRKDRIEIFGEDPGRNVDFLPDATPYGYNWNIKGPGGRVDMDIEVKTIDSRYRVNDWLSLRAVVNWWTREMGSLESGRYHVRGDGSITVTPVVGFGLYNDTRQMNYEAIISQEVFGVTNRLLLGYGQFNDNFHFLDYKYKRFSEQPEWFDNTRGWRPFEDPYFDLSETIAGWDLIRGNGKRGEQRNYYMSWGTEWFDGRLNTLVGYRIEQIEEEFVNGQGGLISIGKKYEEKSPMFGASFEIMEGVSAFGSFSRSARPGPGSMILGPGATDEELGNPGPPGLGKGIDFGLKASIRDNYITGSMSWFQVSSENESVVKDVERTDNDPRNNDENPNNNVIWQQPAGERQSSGLEVEMVFTPSRNYQAVFSYTWLAEAEIVEDPLEPQFNGKRLGVSPEHTFGLWNKYEFTEGRLEGLSIGLGAKYMGSYNAQGPYSDNQYEMDDFLVFDLLLRYVLEWREHPVEISLNIQNLLDKDYFVRPAAEPGEPIRASLTMKLTY